MVTTINILLTSLGLIGTLSAFGGKTWSEGDEPIHKRITKRGYISLTCLILAFGLGVYKEISNNKNIDNKNSEILQLKAQLSSYKDILNLIKNESHRQQQVVMGQFVSVAGRWNAPNFLYPGSIIKFYNFGRNGNLIIRYGNPKSGYKEDRLNINRQGDGIPYEIPIVGNSGESFEWSLIGNWEGKVFVFSSPRQREPNWSWTEEASEN
ncbi:MAG: hypothetical protein KBC56_02695 [Flavobacterium sp.]|nr:hypothetical protein [Flavobacterium sp.]